MRRPFTKTCDVFQGAHGGIPGALRGTVACRFVKEIGEFIVGAGAPVRVAYITMKDVQPRGPWLSPAFGYDPQLADEIAFPSGSFKQFWVIFVEEVLWRGQALYYRAHVAYGPPPAVPGIEPSVASGGIVFGGSGGNGVNVSGAGGILIGGAGDTTP